jgi:hypothetical protein
MPKKALTKARRKAPCFSCGECQGKNIPIFWPNSIGRRKTFGQMGILLVVLARFHQPPYKNI